MSWEIGDKGLGLGLDNNIQVKAKKINKKVNRHLRKYLKNDRAEIKNKEEDFDLTLGYKQKLDKKRFFDLFEEISLFHNDHNNDGKAYIKNEKIFKEVYKKLRKFDKENFKKKS